MKKLILIIGLCLLWASIGSAATYYVDINLSTDNVYNGTSCNGDYSIAERECLGSDGDAYESIEDLHAGEVMAAGDIVNIRAGTYDDAAGSDEEHYIVPEASGTSWAAMITYQAYNSEVVNITGRGGYSGVDMRAKVASNGYDYIKIKGLNFYGQHNSSGCINLSNSDYWIIENVNCLATGASADDIPGKLIYLSAATNIYFIGNGVDGKSDEDSGSDNWDDTISDTGTINHIIFYKWQFGRGTHDAALLSGSQIVIWDCVVSNVYHTGLGFQTSTNILIHNTDFYLHGSQTNPYSGADTNADHPALYSDISNSIVRLNKFWKNGVSINLANFSTSPHDTWIYHNTLYDAKSYATNQTPSWWAQTHLWLGDDELGGTDRITDFRFLNNIFSTAENTGITRFDYTTDGPGSPTGCIVDYNVWYDPNGELIGWEDGVTQDNLRNLATMISEESEWLANNINTDPAMVSPGNQDFRLSSNSDAIDGGTHITEIAAADSGTGSTVVVDDTRGFFDPSSWGFNESDLSTLGLSEIAADYIKIGTGSPIQISSIMNNTTIVLLSDPGSRNEDDPVYYCPGGVCFDGAAPDIGALEYVGIVPPPNDYGRTIAR